MWQIKKPWTLNLKWSTCSKLYRKTCFTQFTACFLSSVWQLILFSKLKAFYYNCTYVHLQLVVDMFLFCCFCYEIFTGFYEVNIRITFILLIIFKVYRWTLTGLKHLVFFLIILASFTNIMLTSDYQIWSSSFWGTFLLISQSLYCIAYVLIIKLSI